MKSFVILSRCLISQLSFGQGMCFGTANGEPTVVKEDKPPKERSKFRENLFVGGNFGFQFGTVTFIDISPLIGYKVFKNASVGIGITYQYLDWESAGGKYVTHTAGGRVYARYII